MRLEGDVGGCRAAEATSPEAEERMWGCSRAGEGDAWGWMGAAGHSAGVWSRGGWGAALGHKWGCVRLGGGPGIRERMRGKV